MRALLLGCLLIAMVGCAEPPPEPVGNASAGTTTGLKDYVHTMARSRFAIGPSPSHYSEFGIDKVVGDYGVFGTNAKTGMVLALPNADAPSRARPGPKYGADAHNAAVKDYFVGAGLPAEEVGPITVNTTMSAGGAGVDPPAQWQFESYTSRIARQYEGVPVADSYAWAQFNDLGEVVTESVYWPQISEGVVKEAASFQKKLADPASKSAFFSKVPEGGTLVIRHTPGTWEESFHATVSYDVGSFGKAAHYDSDGKEFSLPTEQ